MAAESYEHALALVLKHEGGFANHPRDPGGATMRGVIQRVYDAYRDRKGLGRRSVRLIEDAELQEIYRRQYWDAIRGDDLPAGVDYCVFDGAVNSGPVQSARWLQRALGVSADGHIGEGTLDAARLSGDWENLIDNICDQRMRFLRSLRTWDAFGKGWSRRVAEVRRDGKAMVDSAPAESPMPRPDPRPEDEPVGKAPPPEKTPGSSKTLWSVLMQLIALPGAAFAYLADNPMILFALVGAAAFLALYIGRERLSKIIEEKI
jgi:lysozyme family protein